MSGNDPVLEKQFARHAAPRLADQIALLNAMQQLVLLLDGQGMKRAAMRLLGRLLQRSQPTLPSLALRGQLSIAVTVKHAVSHLLVDIGGQRNGRTILRLRYDPVTHRVERSPLRCREEAWLARHRQPPVDHLPRHFIPGFRPALGHHVVGRIAISHQGDPPSGRARRGQPAPAR
jgi:hypothetical protein